MEKYYRAGQTKDDDITQHMHIACWIPKATYTHSEYILLCYCDIGCINGPQWYIIFTLPFFLNLGFVTDFLGSSENFLHKFGLSYRQNI